MTAVSSIQGIPGIREEGTDEADFSVSILRFRTVAIFTFSRFNMNRNY